MDPMDASLPGSEEEEAEAVVEPTDASSCCFDLRPQEFQGRSKPLCLRHCGFIPTAETQVGGVAAAASLHSQPTPNRHSTDTL